MYTTATAFFEAIKQAGITHCFVNLGSDHPSILEAILHGQRNDENFPRIITCPHEMVALSMADGFARVTGKPQCVIVHVDVGTQALGAAMHNAAVGRAPVLIFAGLSPFTQEGELRGSRTEFIHWLQDTPDQKAIVAQYCRYSAEIKTGTNVKQMVNRALQFATSNPAGPVYLCAAREVMEAEIEPYSIKQDQWDPVEIGGLPTNAAAKIAKALAGAQKPLLVTGYSGRDQRMPGALVELANTVTALRVLDSAASEMCFPADHPAWLGTKQGTDDSVPEADVIVILHCDVPWIQTRCKPREDAIIIHIDIDPLKQRMPLFYLPAQARYMADAYASVLEIIDELKTGQAAQLLASRNSTEDAQIRLTGYEEKLAKIDQVAQIQPDGTFGSCHLAKVLRTVCPSDTIWSVEAVTNTVLLHDGIRATEPGSWINCGGGGLGWSGGATLGIKLATDALNQGNGKFVCQLVGDGTYLFSSPASVYWTAMRYKIPVLVIVLNNNGWNAPRKSHKLVHPDGPVTRATNDDINISFAPTPDYAGIAKAAGAGEIHAFKVTQAAELQNVLREAVAKVQAGTTAVVDCGVVHDC